MTHLHIPDGVLPVWLWAGGAAIAAIGLLLAARRMSRPPFARKLPLLSMTAAFMIVAMSMPIPGGYDVQLAAVAGIILGPAASVIAAFVVNLLLALIGHGGITVVGLNTLVLGGEMAAAWALFRLLRGALSPGLAGGVAAFLAMMIGAGIMIGVVSLGLKGAGALPLEHLTVTAGAHAQEAAPGTIQNLSLPRFAILVLGFGSLGWLFEALITASVIRFAARVKPDLVGLAPRYEPV